MRSRPDNTFGSVAGPQVHRIEEAPKIEVVYEENPILKERNQYLGEEIEALTVKLFNNS